MNERIPILAGGVESRGLVWLRSCGMRLEMDGMLS